MCELPGFMRPLAASLRGADGSPASLGAERFLRTPERTAVPSHHRGNGERAQSAVMVLVCGSSYADAGIVIEERAHTMRSQPAQFALPGGRVDPTDASATETAVREAHEEIGIGVSSHPQLRVLGAWRPIAMPVRPMDVTAVLAWHPLAPKEFAETLRPQPAEVERVIIPPLVGPGSLTDPAVLTRAHVGGAPVGIAFDLPLEPDDPADDAFVWGFTAGLLGAVLTHVGTPIDVARIERVMDVPPTRLLGERKRK